MLKIENNFSDVVQLGGFFFS